MKTTEQLKVQADPHKGSSHMQHLLLKNNLTVSQSRHVLQLIGKNPALHVPPHLMETVCRLSAGRLLSSRQLLTYDTPFHPPKTYPIHPATLQIFPVSGSDPCHYGHPDNRWVSRCGDASLPVSVEYCRPNEGVNQHEETPPESLIHRQQNDVPLEIFVVFCRINPQKSTSHGTVTFSHVKWLNVSVKVRVIPLTPFIMVFQPHDPTFRSHLAARSITATSWHVKRSLADVFCLQEPRGCPEPITPTLWFKAFYVIFLKKNQQAVECCWPQCWDNLPLIISHRSVRHTQTLTQPCRHAHDVHTWLYVHGCKCMV